MFNKYHGLLLTIFISSLVSCIRPKQHFSQSRFLDQPCTETTLRHVLLDTALYPAIAIENSIEAVIKYNIKSDDDLKVSISKEQYFQNCKRLNIDSSYTLGLIFNKFLYSKISQNCPDIEKGKEKLTIAYKLISNPNCEESKGIDLIIKRDSFTLIETNSH